MYFKFLANLFNIKGLRAKKKKCSKEMKRNRVISLLISYKLLSYTKYANNTGEYYQNITDEIKLGYRDNYRLSVRYKET